jgi:hypothetical protein
MDLLSGTEEEAIARLRVLRRAYAEARARERQSEARRLRERVCTERLFAVLQGGPSPTWPTQLRALCGERFQGVLRAVDASPNDLDALDAAIDADEAAAVASFLEN